ncbi:unnamed protein product [Rotaria sp. Silwood2]|nr:unnamed protein product [Rotaria sp. Silwood2]
MLVPPDTEVVFCTEPSNCTTVGNTNIPADQEEINDFDLKNFKQSYHINRKFYLNQCSCYITLTQSFHFIMGDASAGPARTGKIEATKDLGRALGVMVYVYNCSEQMDYQSIGNIYKGLSPTDA